MIVVGERKLWRRPRRAKVCNYNIINNQCGPSCGFPNRGGEIALAGWLADKLRSSSGRFFRFGPPPPRAERKKANNGSNMMHSTHLTPLIGVGGREIKFQYDNNKGIKSNQLAIFVSYQLAAILSPLAGHIGRRRGGCMIVCRPL